MDIFNNENKHLEEQLEIYKELIEEKTKALDELDGAGDGAVVIQQRERLQEEIRHLQLNMEQVQDGAQRAGLDVETYERERDLFND